MIINTVILCTLKPSIFVLLRPLIEILVAEEVDGVENVPAIRLEFAEFAIVLGAKDHTARLVLLNLRHQVLLSHVDEVILTHL